MLLIAVQYTHGLLGLAVAVAVGLLTAPARRVASGRTATGCSIACGVTTRPSTNSLPVQRATADSRSIRRRWREREPQVGLCSSAPATDQAAPTGQQPVKETR